MIIVFMSMNPETAVTFTCGHFNKVVFAVCRSFTFGMKILKRKPANWTKLTSLL